MKKFLVIFLTVILLVMCMLISASAVEDVYPEFPETVGSDYLICDNSGVITLFSAGAGDFFLNTSNPSFLFIILYQVPTYILEDGHWVAVDFDPFAATYMFDRILYNSFDIVSDEGVVLKASNPYIVPSDSSVLPSAVSSDSLGGVLKEVLSLVAVVVPVVLGYFGIRKGVSWLLARIRST